MCLYLLPRISGGMHNYMTGPTGGLGDEGMNEPHEQGFSEAATKALIRIIQPFIISDDKKDWDTIAQVWIDKQVR